jgi:hypothetical protein
MKTDPEANQSGPSPNTPMKNVQKAFGFIIPLILVTIAIALGPNLRAEAPTKATLASAVWNHAQKCSWELEGAPISGLLSGTQIEVESVKWIADEEAVEFTLCFVKAAAKAKTFPPTLYDDTLGDYKRNKEWVYTGKWKLKSSGIIGFRKWAVSDAPGTYTPTSREPSIPFTRPRVERM